MLRLSALFALDAFAGGFVMQSFIAFWFSERFGVDPGVLGVILFGANILAGRLGARGGSPGGPLRARPHDGVHAPAVERAAHPGARSCRPCRWPCVVLLVRFSISQMDVPTRQSYTMAIVAPDERSAAAGRHGHRAQPGRRGVTAHRRAAAHRVRVHRGAVRDRRRRSRSSTTCCSTAGSRPCARPRSGRRGPWRSRGALDRHAAVPRAVNGSRPETSPSRPAPVSLPRLVERGQMDPRDPALGPGGQRPGLVRAQRMALRLGDRRRSPRPSARAGPCRSRAGPRRRGGERGQGPARCDRRSPPGTTEAGDRGERSARRATFDRPGDERRRAREPPAVPSRRARSASRGTAVVRIRSRGAESADRIEASTGRIRSSAAARYESRTAASLSRSSTVSQATGRGSRASHWARRVVLPYPGGAVIATTRGPLVAMQELDQARPVDRRLASCRRQELGLDERQRGVKPRSRVRPGGERPSPDPRTPSCRLEFPTSRPDSRDVAAAI